MTLATDWWGQNNPPPLNTSKWLIWMNKVKKKKQFSPREFKLPKGSKEKVQQQYAVNKVERPTALIFWQTGVTAWSLTVAGPGISSKCLCTFIKSVCVFLVRLCLQNQRMTWCENREMLIFICRDNTSCWNPAQTPQRHTGHGRNELSYVTFWLWDYWTRLGLLTLISETTCNHRKVILQP